MTGRGGSWGVTHAGDNATAKGAATQLRHATGKRRHTNDLQGQMARAARAERGYEQD